MIFVLLGTPSSGGPRCLRGVFALVFGGLASTLIASLSPVFAVRASLVVTVRSATWPGALVGVPLVAASSVSPLVFALHRVSDSYDWYACVGTYATTTASRAASTSTTASASTSRRTATLLAFTALGSFSSVRLRLASELHRHLAVHDRLAVEFVDGALGLGRGGHINEGVADRTGRAWVGRDGCGLAVCLMSVQTMYRRGLDRSQTYTR